MKTKIRQRGLSILSIITALFTANAYALQASEKEMNSLGTPDTTIQKASVRYLKDLDLLVFELKVSGKAGATTPQARGKMDGAPVLGYVFPTTLKSEDVGFNATDDLPGLPDEDENVQLSFSLQGDYCPDCGSATL